MANPDQKESRKFDFLIVQDDPSSVEAVFATDFQSMGKTINDFNIGPTIAQAAAVGEPFQRTIQVTYSQIPETVKPPTQTRIVDIQVGFDELGDNIYVHPSDSDVPSSDLPSANIDFVQHEGMDQAVDGAVRLKTRRKKRSSHRFIDTDKIIQTRGGNPHYRASKPESSFRIPLRNRSRETT